MDFGAPARQGFSPLNTLQIVQLCIYKYVAQKGVRRLFSVPRKHSF